MMTSKTIVVPVEPVPAARPRVYRHGTTYPKTYQTYRVAAHSWAETQQWTPVEGPLLVITEFVVRKPRTSKLSHPRGDVDNYAKSVLDVLNGRAWGDDTQIIHLIAKKRFAAPNEEPRTIVTIEPS